MIGLYWWHLVGLVSFAFFLMAFTKQEKHSGYPTRFASPYIMRLLKRGGLNHGVRSMKRDNEGLEANGGHGIGIIKKKMPEVNDQRSSKIILWRGEPYFIEMPKQGGEDTDEYETGMVMIRRNKKDPYGVGMMKRAEDSARIIKKESNDENEA